MNYEVIYYVLLVTLLGIALHTPTLTLIQLVRQCVPVVSLIDNSLTLYASLFRGRYDRVNGSLYRAYKDEQSRHSESLWERQRPRNDFGTSQHSGHAE